MVKYYCTSPIGRILLSADAQGLTGLWLEGARYFAAGIPDKCLERKNDAIYMAIKWIEIYFSGREPQFTPPLHLTGSSFRMRVWSELMKIPYGSSVSYGDIAAAIGTNCARSVGGAVGHNPISIIVPCHRVLGANGKMTGYAAGLEVKQHLLKLEGII